MKKMNILGEKFGKLTVVEEMPSENNRSMWKCVCDCGNEKIVSGHDLKNGSVVSCGCYWRERIKESNSTHGCTGTRLHKEWRGMKTRCYIPSCSNYKYYGGKGIKVCDEWKNNFSSFKEWSMKNGYNENMTIDRIDNEKDYSPENCRWLTFKENCWNRDRKNRKNNTSGFRGVFFRKETGKWRVTITVNGKRINLGTFSEKEDAIKARKEAEEKYWEIK